MKGSATVLVCAAICASTTPAQDTYTKENHVYKTVDDTSLSLTLYRPVDATTAAPARPIAVFFFGGGWRSGSTEQFTPHCEYLAGRGMLAATVDYRVASRHGVKARACVEDAKSAVRWLRKNAKRLQIDPDRICAAGGSAGGHIACCTATIDGFDATGEDPRISSRPNAMALFNPAVILAPLEGAEIPFDEDKLADIASRTGVPPKEISPAHHIRAGLPPTIIFHGIADTTVPITTVETYQRRATKAGNDCTLIRYADAPHSFFNAPKGKNAARRDRSDQWFRRTLLALDGFLCRLGWLADPPEVRVVDRDFVALRGDLTNCLSSFAHGKAHVAFLGGSITEMDGYRPKICKWLQQRFPNTEFTFTNAGIASTCSQTGAFRLSRDVLSKGDIDLLFVEFAVNDDQDAAHSPESCLSGMEGIIRHTLRHNPKTDILMTHFVNPGMLELIKQGKPIVSASQHERLAVHYNLSSVYLSRVVAQEIGRGSLTWQQFGGTHPGPVGNQLAADCATRILDAAWRGIETNVLTPQDHVLPNSTLSSAPFANGTLESPESAAQSDWKFSEPAWNNLPGGKRSRFLDRKLLHCDTPNATTKFRFTGTAIGVFVLAGPDAGQLDFRVDDGEWQSAEMYHRFSRSLHYPRTIVLADGLNSSTHEIELRVGSKQHARSQGHAIRILDFAVNARQNAN